MAAGVYSTEEQQFERAVTGNVTNLQDTELTRNTGAVIATPALNKIFDIESEERPLFFLSDIRTGNITEKTFEEDVKRNMDDQMVWRNILNPDFAMLKFRLPYTTVETDGVVHEAAEQTTEYLDGEIQLQIWAPQTSTETRLIVPKNAPLRVYDHKLYEDVLYFQNTVVREQMHYDHDLKNGKMDHHWDSRAEIAVLRDLLGDNDYPVSAEAVADLVQEISNTLHKSFDKQAKSLYRKYLEKSKKQGFEAEAQEIVHKSQKERVRDVWWKNAGRETWGA